MDMDNFKPNLVEPGVKYFLSETLKQTHLFRLKHYNSIYNVGLLCAFLLILGIILFVKFKGRLTVLEKEKKEQDKKQYILSKIKKLQEMKKQAHQELITGLPHWEKD
jgi:cytoskeletal protein RodZ